MDVDAEDGHIYLPKRLREKYGERFAPDPPLRRTPEAGFTDPASRYIYYVS
jgi:hypothetical protein